MYRRQPGSGDTAAPDTGAAVSPPPPTDQKNIIAPDEAEIATEETAAAVELAEVIDAPEDPDSEDVAGDSTWAVAAAGFNPDYVITLSPGAADGAVVEQAPVAIRSSDAHGMIPNSGLWPPDDTLAACMKAACDLNRKGEQP